MFKRDVHDINDLVNQFLRQNGLEMPLLQKRLIDAWGKVAGKVIERYTEEKYICQDIPSCPQVGSFHDALRVGEPPQSGGWCADYY